MSICSATNKKMTDQSQEMIQTMGEWHEKFAHK